MSPRFLVGVDGGGTATRAYLTDAQGRPLGRGQAGPSALRLGPAASWAALQAAIGAAFADAGLPAAPLHDCAIGLGLAGAGAPALARAFLAAAPACARLELRTDAMAAVRGAHGGRPGAVLIAGTGSVLAALDAGGRDHLIGGWGFPVGDEGSGAWIGCAAMRHAQQVLEHRAADGALAAAVRAVAGTDRRALLDWCAGADATAWATLAPLVFDHATADPAAAVLLDAAAAALAALVAALDATTARSSDAVDAMAPLAGGVASPLPLALSGGIATLLAPRLAGHLGAPRLVPALADAAVGAWRLVAPSLATGGTPPAASAVSA